MNMLSAAGARACGGFRAMFFVVWIFRGTSVTIYVMPVTTRCATVQVEIAWRGLEALRVGGLMAYSTCTYNPIEGPYAYAYAYAHVIVYVYVCIYTHVCMYIDIDTYSYAYANTHVDVFSYVRSMYGCVCVSGCGCVYMRICVCMHMNDILVQI